MKIKNILYSLLLVAATLICASIYYNHTFNRSKAASAEASNEKPVRQKNEGVPAVTNVSRLDWRLIESGDYAQYVKNLRESACPEATVEDIIVADVNECYNKKAAPMLNMLKNQVMEYYTKRAPTNNMALVVKPAYTALDALNGERIKLIEKLLAHEVPKEKLAFVPWEHYLSQLKQNKYPYIEDDKKRQCVEEAMLKIKNELAVVFGRSGTLDAATSKQYDEICQRHYRNMKEILSTDEYRSLILNESTMANLLAEKYKNINISPDEYRNVVLASVDYYDKYGAMFLQTGCVPEDAAGLQAKKSDDAIYEAGIKNIIGNEKYYDMLMNNDYRYRETFEFVERNQGLSSDSARVLYDLRVNSENQFIQLRQNSGIADKDRAVAISEIVSKAKNEIEKRLGPEYGGKYFNGSSGQWIAIIENNGRVQTHEEASVIIVPDN